MQQLIIHLVLPRVPLPAPGMYVELPLAISYRPKMELVQLSWVIVFIPRGLSYVAPTRNISMTCPMPIIEKRLSCRLIHTSTSTTFSTSGVSSTCGLEMTILLLFPRNTKSFSQRSVEPAPLVERTSSQLFRSRITVETPPLLKSLYPEAISPRAPLPPRRFSDVRDCSFHQWRVPCARSEACIPRHLSRRTFARVRVLTLVQSCSPPPHCPPKPRRPIGIRWSGVT